MAHVQGACPTQAARSERVAPSQNTAALLRALLSQCCACVGHTATHKRLRNTHIHFSDHKLYFFPFQTLSHFPSSRRRCCHHEHCHCFYFASCDRCPSQSLCFPLPLLISLLPAALPSPFRLQPFPASSSYQISRFPRPLVARRPPFLCSFSFYSYLHLSCCRISFSDDH